MRPYITAAIIGITAIISFAIIGNAYRSRASTMETIVVTGLAEKDFTSNLIVWRGTYSQKSMDLKTAYALLKADEGTIRSYLNRKGISNSAITFSSVNINKDFAMSFDENGRNTGQRFTGYNLMQTVKVESTDVDKVDKISREATELIEKGIEFNSSSPLFYNTNLTL